MVETMKPKVHMKVVVTKVGLAKIMEATIENPLKLKRFAVGDGNGVPIEPNENMTSLVNEKYRDFLNDSYSNGNNLTIECVLRANAPITEGFKIFELGIFDEAGDMIAISQTPEQYRPSNSEGVATEWIASIVLQLQNTANIQIEIPQTVFATVDALQRLTDTVNSLISSRNEFINSCIGVEKLFNTDNSDKDKNIITRGVKTYALMDDSNILKILDYPFLFKNIKAVDRGDGTFTMPKFHDGTVRNLPKGSSRNLGSYEADDIKSHLHTTSNHTHKESDHVHGIPDIKGELDPVANSQIGSAADSTASGAFAKIAKGLRKVFGQSASSYQTVSFSFSSHRAGVTATNKGGGGTTSSAGGGNTSSTGGAETRMKNTAGQWYVLAKVNI